MRVHHKHVHECRLAMVQWAGEGNVTYEVSVGGEAKEESERERRERMCLREIKRDKNKGGESDSLVSV